jgi:ATP-dependent RNA helicase RhlE
VLVAIDIAARGIDIEGITHVINFDLPNIPESYVHRIGRTGRAGASGIALSFCDAEERTYLKDIEKTIRRSVPVVAEHPYRSTATGPRTPAPQNQGGHRPARQGGAPRHGGGGRRQGGNGGGQGRRSGGGSGRSSAAPAQRQSAAPAAPSRPTMPKWS